MSEDARATRMTCDSRAVYVCVCVWCGGVCVWGGRGLTRACVYRCALINVCVAALSHMCLCRCVHDVCVCVRVCVYLGVYACVSITPVCPL